MATNGQGTRALQARSLVEADPEHQASARVRPPDDLSVGQYTVFRQARPRQMLEGTLLARPPAPARPPTPRSARRSLHPLGGSLLHPRRPQLRPPPATQASPRRARAHAGSGAPGRQWHHVAAPLPPSTALRSARPLSPPLLWRASSDDPRALQWVLGEDCRRKEGGKAPASTPLGSCLADRPRLMSGGSLSVTSRQLLEARGGEGRCGAGRLARTPSDPTIRGMNS